MSLYAWIAASQHPCHPHRFGLLSPQPSTKLSNHAASAFPDLPARFGRGLCSRPGRLFVIAVPFGDGSPAVILVSVP
jgi:hypothetical protein